MILCQWKPCLKRNINVDHTRPWSPSRKQAQISRKQERMEQTTKPQDPCHLQGLGIWPRTVGGLQVLKKIRISWQKRSQHGRLLVKKEVSKKRRYYSCTCRIYYGWRNKLQQRTVKSLPENNLKFKDMWILDSGRTEHMTDNRFLLSWIKLLKSRQTINVAGICLDSWFVIKNVLLVPDLGYNLLSVPTVVLYHSDKEYGCKLRSSWFSNPT
jgi:hypothetical protein